MSYLGYLGGDCLEIVDGTGTGKHNASNCQEGYICQNDKCPMSYENITEHTSCCSEGCNKNNLKIYHENATCCRKKGEKVFSLTSRRTLILD